MVGGRVPAAAAAAAGAAAVVLEVSSFTSRVFFWKVFQCLNLLHLRFAVVF